VFLQYLVWENDAKGFEDRMEQFLSIANRRGIRTLCVLFDECAFVPVAATGLIVPGKTVK
jgi:hypothetical protein